MDGRQAEQDRKQRVATIVPFSDAKRCERIENEDSAVKVVRSRSRPLPKMNMGDCIFELNSANSEAFLGATKVMVHQKVQRVTCHV